MLPVLHGDVVAVARALMPMDMVQRAGFVRRLINGAELAHDFRRNIGQLHPVWGDGSLEVAANHFVQVPEPYLDDSQYCHCMMIVFEELLAWRLGQTS